MSQRGSSCLDSLFWLGGSMHAPVRCLLAGSLLCARIFLLLMSVTARHGCRLDGISALTLGSLRLLLLQVGLVLESLLLIRRHTIRAGCHGCTSWLHSGLRRRNRGVVFLGRLDRGLAVDTIPVCRFGCVETRLAR